MTRWFSAFCMLLLSSAHAAQQMQWLEEPRLAPAFTLPSTDGGQRTLDSYRGGYVLVNFWAVWCAPCRKEMPSMQTVYAELGEKGLAMAAIHVGPSMEQAKSFADDLGLTFDILVDEQMALSDWQVLGLPTTYLIDPEGRIVAKAVGEREWTDPKLVGQLRNRLSSE